MEKKEVKKNKNYLNTQVKAIIVLALAIAILVPVWFLFLKPEETPVDNSTSKPTPSQTYSLYDTATFEGSEDKVGKIDMKNLESFHITKGEHTWGFVYDYTDEMFFLDGYGKKVAYDTLALSFMQSFVSMGTAQRLVAEKVSDFSKYGLDADAEDLITVDVATRDGKKTTIYLGDALIDNSGYYATAKGSTSVYTINPMNYGYFSSTELEVMNTRITNPFTESEYVPNYFAIYHGSEKFVELCYYDTKTALEMELIKTTVVQYPKTALPHGASGRYSDMLYNKVRDSIYGEVVVAAEKADQTDGFTVEYLKENFGIDPTDPACKRLVFYRDFEEVGRIENDVLFSAKSKDGYYFAYNMALGTVVKIPASQVEFIEWSVEQYMEPAVYMQSINAVKKLTIDSTAMADLYFSKGNLRLNHTFDSNAPEEEEADKLQVTFDGGKKLSDVKLENGETRSGLDNYRYLFLALQSVDVYEKIDDPEAKGVNLDKPDITVTIQTRSSASGDDAGNVVLKFYYYGSTRAYFTYNGGGGYCVPQSALMQMLIACRNVTEGVAVK